MGPNGSGSRRAIDAEMPAGQWAGGIDGVVDAFGQDVRIITFIRIQADGPVNLVAMRLLILPGSLQVLGGQSLNVGQNIGI